MTILERFHNTANENHWEFYIKQESTFGGNYLTVKLGDFSWIIQFLDETCLMNAYIELMVRNKIKTLEK